MKKRMITILLSLSMFAQSALCVSAAEMPFPNTGAGMAGETDADTATETDTDSAAETDADISVETDADSATETDADIAAALEDAKESLSALLSSKTVSALVYLCDYYELRDGYSEDANSIIPLPSGQLVFLEGVELDGMRNVWYRVSCGMDDREYTGYIQRDYLAYADEDFLAWENDFPLNYSLSPRNLKAGTADIAQFPASYQAALTALKAAHPNWTFVAMNTNLDWDYVIENEDYQDRSLVPSSSPAAWKKGDSGQKGWSIASVGILKYYMDPRNFLGDPHIFQFEQLTYNGSYHTVDAVQQILASTFMNGAVPGDGRSYAQVFYDIGRELGVSPFHLACRVYQEQGKGTSPLISGTYPGYEGYYNYFNIGASGNSDKAVIENGLKTAKERGWTTPYASLRGGAEVISANYIRKGQDTLYLQKFDVDGSYNGMFYHQYMQNICAPSSESANIRKAYSNTGALDNPFVFKIPVYKNMPDSPCPQPKDYVFSDVEVIEGNWRYESINYVYEKGLMTGISGTTLFQPDGLLDRAMFATILHRAAGSPDVAYTDRFSDVPDNKYYSIPILWAYHEGIVSGYSDGSNRYGVNDNIERQQMAKMLYKYASLKGYDVTPRQSLDSFPDAPEVAPWAVECMEWATATGMINGKHNGDTYILAPKAATSRVECAAMLTRFLQKYEE